MAEKNNDQVLNEAFFSKKNKSFSDSLADKQVQYAPVKSSKNFNNLFNGNSKDGFIISDKDEVKNRIVGALGMAMGNNTVKSMANKAIKTFPIIVSDNVAPETVVMLKTMFEEQYASYIDLMVSNQIIDLTDYDPDNSNGNIAIQALNKISGNEFGSGRIARQMQTGSVSVDDVMANTPGWQFLRTNEGTEYKSGNEILDTLLENAIITPSEYTNTALNALYEEMLSLQEAPTTMPWYGYLGNNIKESDVTDAKVIATVNAVTHATPITAADCVAGQKFLNLNTNICYVRDAAGAWKAVTATPEKRKISEWYESIEKTVAADRYNKYGFKYDVDDSGIVANERVTVNKLLTPSTMIDTIKMNNAMDESIASILTGEYIKDKSTAQGKAAMEISAVLKDKFTKASHLLASNRITGAEYISYVTDRLGIPISQADRAELVRNYKASDLIFKGSSLYNSNGELTLSTDDIVKLTKSIDANDVNVLGIAKNLTKIRMKDVAHIAAASAVGAGAAGLASFLASGLLLGPFIGAVVGGAAVGGLSVAIAKLIKKQKEKRLIGQKVSGGLEGWERVERLIEDLERNQEAVLMNSSDRYKRLERIGSDDVTGTKEFLTKEKASYENFSKKMDMVLNGVSKDFVVTENFNIDGFVQHKSEERLERALNELCEIDSYLREDAEATKEILALNEATKYIISTRKPQEISLTKKFNKKDIDAIVPEFGTKNVTAYGSVEYDKREIKDRKYNEPLLLTVKFKERYSDGKYVDNELTAVIGILGVVTRVPSEEMETILRANADGKVLDNFFKGDENNNSKSLISNVISNFMGTKYADKLPASGKVWANLEKVTALAVANKLAGNNHGNVANAHLVFAQKEIDNTRMETGVDYLKSPKLAAQLMKRYSAFAVLVCDDIQQYVYRFDDPDSISWDEAPYSAYLGKSNSDQFLSALTQLGRSRI